MTKKKMNENDVSVPAPPSETAGEINGLTKADIEEVRGLMHKATGSLGSSAVQMLTDFCPPYVDNGKVKEQVEKYFETIALFDPKDPVEGMLASKIMALGRIGAKMLNQASVANCPQTTQSLGNIAVKLLRLQNETLEILSRYRRGGQQTVLVQHVNVESGGKALLGNVLNGGGANQNLGGNSP